ncbi:MAG: MBOAT family protein [Oscillospiraceae bacterium]|jgi:alginate O-acetyltransferase complex protein AlgI|nr:MBOAT family protein [Oscillospiraceae bacterium]
MVFSSFVFIVLFLPVALILYCITPQRFKNILLVAFSLIFYVWGLAENIWLLLGSILFNYLLGLLLGHLKDKAEPKLSRLILTLGIIANLSVLFYYKYLLFALKGVNLAFHSHISIGAIALPVGISFFTFQGIAYLVDIHKGRFEAEKNLVGIALYMSFFPKLVQGPIMRYSDIKSQLTGRRVTPELLASGINRFIIGLSKKVIIADILGLSADKIFGAVSLGMDTPTAWIGIICYTFQIYFDFSGYSDMAIGLGQMFGFKIIENFNYPYISQSATELWRRWHISLSTWFREYLYIPLGGNRKHVYFNIFIVFLATGIWHGADLTFILWGALYGVLIVIEKRFLLKKAWYERLPAVLKGGFTFISVMLLWVLFRANSIRIALDYYKALLGIGINTAKIEIFWQYYIDKRLIFTIVIAIAASLPYAKLKERIASSPRLATVKSVTLSLLFAVCVVYMINSTYSPFIYFQF